MCISYTIYYKSTEEDHAYLNGKICKVTIIFQYMLQDKLLCTKYCFYALHFLDENKNINLQIKDY